jgi:glycosyltransferase 2 family protein
MTKRPWLRRLISFLLIIAAFAFLGREIVRNVDSLREFEWQLRPGILILSVAALVVVLTAGVGYWAIVLRGFGVHAPLLPLARTWFLANLSRYIPGMVWQFVSLAQFGGGAGLTPVVSITSLLVQMGFMLLSATALGVLLLPGSSLGDAYPLLRQLRWLAPLVLAAVHPVVIRTLVGLLGRLSRRATVGWNGSWLQGIALLLLATVLWLAYGVAFFLFLSAFVALPLSLLPAVTAIHALAFLVGYIAFFAPAGLGFKDAALTLLLAGLLPSSVAASLAVLARLWSIAGELLPAVALLPAGLRRGGRSAPGAVEAPPPAPPDDAPR